MDKQKYNNYPLAISQILGLIEVNALLFGVNLKYVTLWILYIKAIQQVILSSGKIPQSN